MKIGIEDYLQRIDTIFKNKSQKDINIIYIMIFVLIFAISYLFFWDNSLASFQEKNKQINSITSKINEDKKYLQFNPEAKVNRLDKTIRDTEGALVTQKENNAYIKSKIETISSLIYDERTWGEYLHSISINAKKYDIKVIDFKNEYSKNTKAFGHILNIELKVDGKYKNILKFINSLEQSELVVDIHDLSIKAQDKLTAELFISVWGITY